MKRLWITMVILSLLLCLFVSLSACKEFLDSLNKKDTTSPDAGTVTQTTEDENATEDKEKEDDILSVDFFPIGITGIDALVIDVENKSLTASVEYSTEQIALSDFLFNIADTAFTVFKDRSLTQPTTDPIPLLEGENRFFIRIDEGADVVYTLTITRNAAPVHVHEYGDWETLEAPTCQKEGLRQKTCSSCGEKVTESISALSHTPVTDPAVEPTCTENGLTEGSHCASCGLTLVEQQPIEATGHTPVTDPAVDPTCTTDGLTEGSHCLTCLQVLVEQQPVVSTGHTPVIDFAVDATCTEDGLTEGSHCSVCGVTLEEQQTVKATGHKPITDSAVDPSCTEDGLTEGSHCSVCGLILLEQQVIEAKGHTPADPVEENLIPATCTEAGSYDSVTYCNACGAELARETVAIKALDHDLISHDGQAATCTEDGWEGYETCSRCDYSTYRAIPAKGHTPVTDPAVDPTCTTDGLTEGSHCSTCGTIFIEQKTVEAKGHTPVTDAAVDATCTEDGLTEGSHCSLCGLVFLEQEIIEAKGHTPTDPVQENHIPATCTEAGSYDSVTYCNACGAELARETVAIKALDHDLVPHDGQAATCTEDGWEDYETCSRCDYTTYQAIPAKGHTPVTDPAVDPTCTTDGLTEGSHCSTCGTILIEQKTVEAKGHTPVTDPAVAPTCTQTGLTEGSHCAVCGLTLTEQQSVQATGHTPTDPVEENHIPATCTEAGSYDSVTYCSDCGAELAREAVTLNALGHDIIPHDGQAATCTEDGWKAYETCSRCDYSTYQAIPAKGHTPVTDAAMEATCTEDGLTEGSHCSICGTILIEQKTVEAKGHTPVTDHAVAPTCTQTGLSEGSHCAVCGLTLTEQQPVQATGHTPVTDAAIDATCTEDGLTEGSHCSVCGTVFTEQQSIKATGHTPVTDPAVAPTCTQTGLTEGSHCSVCGAILTEQQVLPALEHDWEDREILLAPTCTTEGSKQRRCALCETVEVVSIPASDHDYHASVTEPTCTAQGYTAYACSRCDACYVDSYVAALGHDVIPHDGQAATCTEDGYNAYETCSRCDYTTYQTIAATGHDYQATHYDGDCITYERNEWVCSRCFDAYTQVLSEIYAPHDYVAYTCSVCQHDEMADYAERFSSGEVVTLQSVREVAILIDYLVFTHCTDGICFVIPGMTTDDCADIINNAMRMKTITNWPIGYQTTKIGNTVQSVRVYCPSPASGYDFDQISTVTPESGDYTAVSYSQCDFYEMPIQSTRAKDFDDFPYEQRRYTIEVTDGEQLFFAFEHGYRPIPVKNSAAERLLNKAKEVNRAIINDSMTDREKAYYVMLWLVQNVAYDYGIIDEEHINHCYASSYYLEGVFDYGLAVCDAFSKAVCVMLGLEDIKCVRLVGNNHAWNRVYLDPDGDGVKDWYVLDVTHANSKFLIVTASYEVLLFKQFLISDSQKTAMGYTSTNYLDDNSKAVTETNPFAVCYYKEQTDDSCDYVITSNAELSALFNALWSQLPPKYSTYYFTVNVFIPKSYCKTESAVSNVLKNYLPKKVTASYSISYSVSELTYDETQGWNCLIAIQHK